MSRKTSGLVVLSLMVVTAPGFAGDYDHVTITSAALASCFAPLSDFLQVHLGLTDTVVTVENIYSNYPGRDGPEKIRNFIRDAYANWSTTHVLLGGDADVIPRRLAWGKVRNAGLVPCDQYYSGLEGDWDANQNSTFGEMDDSVDVYPDVFLGRATVSDTATADLFVGKFLTYSTDSTADYLRNVLLCGMNLDRLAFSETTMEIYDSTYVPETMKPCTKVYDSQQGSHAQKTLAALNAGQHFWIHSDHGDRAWMGCGYLEHRAWFTPGALDSLANGDKLTILISVACNIGAFDTSDCIVETFLSSPSGGAVAAFANSRFGFYEERVNPQRELSYLVVESCIAELFGHAEGNASLEDITLAKARIAPLVHASSAYRYVTFEMNLFGEPAMKVWMPSLAGMAEQPAPKAEPAMTVQTCFNSQARLRFDLPQESRVQLAIFDRGGRRVAVLADGLMQAGTNEALWDGCGDDGRKSPAGVYYVRLRTADGRVTGKLVKLGR